MIPLDGLVAAVYVSIGILILSIIIYAIVGFLVLRKRHWIVCMIYFIVSPLFIITGYTLTHTLNSPDYILTSMLLIILFNSFFLPITKRFRKAT